MCVYIYMLHVMSRSMIFTHYRKWLRLAKELVSLEGGGKKWEQSFTRKYLREENLSFFLNPSLAGVKTLKYFFQEYVWLKSCDTAYVEPLTDSCKHGNNSSGYMKLGGAYCVIQRLLASEWIILSILLINWLVMYLMMCEVTEHINVNLKLTDGNIWVWTLVSNIFTCSYYDHGVGVQKASRGRGREQSVVIRT